jgi:hypothetical protein
VARGGLGGPGGPGSDCFAVTHHWHRSLAVGPAAAGLGHCHWQCQCQCHLPQALTRRRVLSGRQAATCEAPPLPVMPLPVACRRGAGLGTASVTGRLPLALALSLPVSSK